MLTTYVVLSYVLWPVISLLIWTFASVEADRDKAGAGSLLALWLFAPIGVALVSVYFLVRGLTSVIDFVALLNAGAKLLSWRHLSDEELLERAEEIRQEREWQKSLKEDK